MAFTRVRGPGITTEDNYRVGIITAAKFVGPIETTVDSDFTNVNVTGIGTIDGVKIGNPSGIITASSSSGIVTYYGDASKLTGLTAGQIPNLAASKITTGTVATARLGSGTANNTTFLRGDQTWASNTSTTINNNANNKVITGSGTADTLEAEGNFTFDGTVVDITGKLRIDISSSGGAGSGNAEGIFLRNTSENDNNAVSIFGGADDYNTAASAINFINVDHSANYGDISFDTRGGGGYGERLRIASNGEITQTAASGNTVITLKRSNTNTTGTVGGINFAALDGHSVASIQARGDGNDDGAHIQFYTTSAAAGDMYNAANIERLRITSDGKVGISEDDPQAQLHINSGANSAIMFGNTTNGYKIRANVTSSNDYGLLIEDEDGVDLYRATSSTGTTNADTHTFFTGGTERLHIQSTGKVIIGTGNRNQETTTGAVLIDRDITAESDAGDPNNYHLVIRSQTNSNTSKLGIGFVNTTDDTTIGASILHHRTGGGSIGDLAFYTSPSDGTINERLRITSDGKVGIGIIAPPDKLNVVGAVRINQSSALDHLCNAGTMLEVRGDGIGSGVVDYDFFKGFKIALNDGTEYGGQAQFAVGRWQENGTNARSSLMISLGHGAQSSSSDADADIMLLTSDGQVRIEDGDLKIGTAGHGIDFSATSHASGMTSETLDDYEEGQWTPTIQFSSGGNTATYTSTTGGWYVKVGKLVTCNGRISISAKGSGSSAVYFGGLPFTVGNHNSGSSGVEGGLTFSYVGNINADKGSGIIGGYASEGTTQAIPFYVDTSNNFHYVEDFDLESDANIGFILTYCV